MPSETINHLYEEIKHLATEIYWLDLPEKFIEAARKQNREKVEELFEEFKENNPELWKRFSEFYGEYEEKGKPRIFAEKGKDYFNYDSSQINPISLCFIFIFSNNIIDEMDAFKEDWEVLRNALHRESQNEIANLMKQTSICGFDELMLAFNQNEN